MDNIMIIDTSIGSSNRGDDIIMECVRTELAEILKGNFEIKLPSHVSSFHWYQVIRNSYAIQNYSNCKLKFVGGSNLLVKDLLTHFPQWNINLFNYKPFAGCILVGVGAGADQKTNRYTTHLYRKLLNNQFYHSVRDQRSKEFVESLSLKAINTGCVTMWCMTPEFCKEIPTQKSSTVVFTLTAGKDTANQDKHIINTLLHNYRDVYFWPQGGNDLAYLHKIANTDNIKILEATKDDYHRFLSENDTDYVGTRLHGGIYAMRHKKRAIIIGIDERAKAIHESNNINYIDIQNIDALESLINSQITTDVRMDFNAIDQWKSQFKSK